MRRLLVAILSAAAGAMAQSPPTPSLPLMPWPSSVKQSPGFVPITHTFFILLTGSGANDPRVKAAAQRAIARLARQTGIPIAVPVRPTFLKPAMKIIVERPDRKGPQKLGDDESYSLQISDTIQLSADGPLGALRGIETFLQLVQQNRSQPREPVNAGFSVPSVSIRDQPRFPWRGLSLDVSRHFLPPDEIKRTIDGLAAVKLNVLHWHLSDDQGFRIESKKYPRLQQYGSDGMFYTQTEVKDIVAYARERGVRIVPEFDMPGHSTSWLPAYPSLASSSGPIDILHEYGDPSGVIDPTKDATYRFLDGFIGEMAKLFPDEYFHIGGDEVSAKAWNTEPHIRDYMKAHHIANAAQLQAMFNKRVAAIVKHHGKRMAGWDEIRQEDLPRSILIQSWRGEKSLSAAARDGFPGILSAGYYLDLMQPASQHYAVDPLHGEAAALTPEQQKLILGGEAAMWEELATAENIDSRLWPRLAAIAERFWSPESVTDVDSMYERLEQTNRWLEYLGLTQRTNLELMLRRLAAPQVDIEPLRLFASILEPVKGYERHRNHYGASSEFNKLVDAIPPESDVAREFRNAVDRYLGAPAPSDADRLRKQLQQWSNNAQTIRPLLETHSLLAEDLPVADSIGAISKAGDEALRYESGGAPQDWKQRTNAALKDANAHHAAMLIAIEPAIQKLVDAVP
jgi:hexosaminidase